MSVVRRTSIELRCAALASFRPAVLALDGGESLSTPYLFRVEVAAEEPGPDEVMGLVRQDVSLTMTRNDGSATHVGGLLERIELTGRERDRWFYRMWVASPLVKLRYIRRSRVFQDTSAVELVKKVLTDAGVQVDDSRLDGSYLKREYCVQYRETDLDFASRLLEDEGIFYFAAHQDEGPDVIVLGDTSSAFQPAPPSAVAYVPQGGALDHPEGVVQALGRTDAAHPTVVRLNDFDFVRPALDLCLAVQQGEPVLEYYEVPGGFVLPAEGRRRTSVRLAEQRAAARHWDGQGDCLWFHPGSVFELEGHPDEHLNRRLVLTEVHHRFAADGMRLATTGTSDEYDNRFDCAADDASLRPARRTPRPKIAGLQPAVVVGSPGEQIHTDQHGRVRVLFPWAQGESCWVRVAQSWAGAGWGALFLPRLGDEVWVGFLSGDPDRPLIMRSAYNAANRPPVQLPDQRLVGGVRTSSVPGAAGHNSLMLDDTAGAERMDLEASRDLRILVKKDKRQEIQGNEHLEVHKNRSRDVGGNQRLEVKGSRESTVLGLQRTRVTLVREVKIGLGETKAVGAASTREVGAVRRSTVTGRHDEQVKGKSEEMIGKDQSVFVGGGLVESVTKNVTIDVKGGSKETIDSDMRRDLLAAASVEVKGDSKLSIEGELTLTVTGKISQKLDGTVEVSVPGPLTVNAKQMILDAATVGIVVGGKLPFGVKSGAVNIAGSKVTVDGSTVKLKGSKVEKVAAGAAESVSDSKEKAKRNPPGTLELNVVDADGRPVVARAYKVTLGDGSLREGVTDSEGTILLKNVPKGSCKLTLPGLDEKEWKLG